MNDHSPGTATARNPVILFVFSVSLRLCVLCV